MRRFTFKRMLMTLLVFMSAMSSWSAEIRIEGTTVYVSGGAVKQDFENLTNDQKTALKNATKLVISDRMDSWDQIRDFFNNQKLVELDLTNLTLTESGEFTTAPSFNAGGWSGLQSITWPNNLTKIPAGCCQGIPLTSLTLPSTVTEIGSDAFNGCKQLATIDLANVQIINSQAFAGCSSLTEVTIPGTVTELKTKAFTDCDGITKITFAEHLGSDGKSDVNMHIEKEVFTQADQIWNIYINTLGTITCDNKAFDMATTFGHGDASAKTATLHYPNSKVDKYCNMGHVLTYEIAQDAGRFHNWLMEHYNQASNPLKNGWYEFVNSGPSSQEDQEPDAKVLRTYSFYYPVTIENGKPVTVAKLVPQGVKAYIVNGITKDGDDYKLSLKSIFAIPANTGVLIYGTPNSMTENDVPSLVMNTVAFEGYPIRRDYWNFMHPDSKVYNMLMPTCIEFDDYGDVKKNDGHEIEVKLASRGIVVKPYDNDADGKVKYRNFFMTKFSSTDLANQYSAAEYVGFFRAKKSYIRSGKAFLRLANTEYDSPKGGEAIILKDGDYKKEYDSQGNPINPSPLWNKLTWEDISDWGVRNLPAGAKAMFFGEPEIEENEDGSATLIISAAGEQEQDGVYYTLQGVKVTNPTAGIYIKNGKKVIVK